jgi:uncharacterized membrane protein YqgA involved in biofilm formation
MRTTIMHGIGLAVLAIGITGLAPLYDVDAGPRRIIIMIGAVIAGGVIGGALELEERLERAGDSIRQRLWVRGREGAVSARGHSGYLEGFVAASIVFCAPPAAILGAIQDGLGGDAKTLAIKSGLDGLVSLGLASVYGAGVLASLVTLVVYEGGITLGAAIVSPLMTAEVIAELGVIGSLLLIGIGLRLLDIAAIRVVNLLPALIIGPLIAGVVESLFIGG